MQSLCRTAASAAWPTHRCLPQEGLQHACLASPGLRTEHSTQALHRSLRCCVLTANVAGAAQ